jgi:ElaB/YqjD/DUF883 family membrane-anchored ribosome-binding protein
MNMKTNTNEQAVHQNVEAAAAGAHKAVDWAADTANSATDSLAETGHEMKATQERWLAIAREYVQENPATSLGIALASGYLLSRLLRAS